MATQFTVLGPEIAVAMGYPAVNSYLLGFAHGILDELTMSGKATFGMIPSPHPISGMIPDSMASLIMGYCGYPSVSPDLTKFCTGVVNHIHMAGIVTYTAPPPAPPAILPPAAWFLNGTISGLKGSMMAEEVRGQMGFPTISPKLLAECTAVCDHIIANAKVVSGKIS